MCHALTHPSRSDLVGLIIMTCGVGDSDADAKLKTVGYCTRLSGAVSAADRTGVRYL